MHCAVRCLIDRCTGFLSAYLGDRDKLQRRHWLASNGSCDWARAVRPDHRTACRCSVRQLRQVWGWIDCCDGVHADDSEGELVEHLAEQCRRRHQDRQRHAGRCNRHAFPAWPRRGEYAGTCNRLHHGIVKSLFPTSSPSEMYTGSSSGAIDIHPMATGIPTAMHARQHDTTKTRRQLRMLSSIGFFLIYFKEYAARK